jgi:hypothetical protein
MASVAEGWKRLIEEWEIVNREEEVAYRVVEVKFVAIAQRASVETPSVAELARWELARKRRADVARQMGEFLKKHSA